MVVKTYYISHEFLGNYELLTDMPFPLQYTLGADEIFRQF